MQWETKIQPQSFRIREKFLSYINIKLLKQLHFLNTFPLNGSCFPSHLQIKSTLKKHYQHWAYSKEYAEGNLKDLNKGVLLNEFSLLVIIPWLTNVFTTKPQILGMACKIVYESCFPAISLVTPRLVAWQDPAILNYMLPHKYATCSPVSRPLHSLEH